MKKLTRILIYLMISLISFSCSKDEFAPSKKTDGFTAPPITTISNSSCTQFSVIKPKVDFLFIWDNSSSQIFINEQTKTALNNTIKAVSSNFDYRILSAPLFGSNGQPAIGNANAFLVANNPSSLSGSALGMLVPSDHASAYLNTYANVGGGNEKGMERAAELLALNSSNGIFRQGAYHIIVLMSNGNDVKTLSNGYTDPTATAANISTQENNLIYLKENVLLSQQLRFISLVAHSTCQAGYKDGTSYKSLSSRIFTRGGAIGAGSADQLGRPYPDSYDICTSAFSNLFDGINSSITEQLVKHKYNHWLVASSSISASSFDPNSIVVKKSSGQVIPQSSSNGWEYLTNPGTGNILTRNSRYEPTVGEPITGHIIKLTGTARITYPECLTITTSSPTDFYAFIPLDVQPKLSSIVLSINGVSIPQSTTNGWEYVGYRSSQNIKSTGSPELRSGYFLQLHGSAMYSNGATININYLPN